MKKTTEEKVSQQKEKDSEKVLKQFNNLPLDKLLRYIKWRNYCLKYYRNINRQI